MSCTAILMEMLRSLGRGQHAVPTLDALVTSMDRAGRSRRTQHEQKLLQNRGPLRWSEAPMNEIAGASSRQDEAGEKPTKDDRRLARRHDLLRSEQCTRDIREERPDRILGKEVSGRDDQVRRE